MNIPESFLKNQTFDTRALGFNRQLIPNYTPDPFAHVEKPPATEVLPDGRVKLHFFAPKAQRVTAGHEDTWVELEMDSSGLWSGLLPYD